MTELHQLDDYSGGALEHLIQRAKQIQAERRARAEQPETQEDRLNRRMTLRNGLILQRDLEKGAL